MRSCHPSCRESEGRDGPLREERRQSRIGPHGERYHPRGRGVKARPWTQIPDVPLSSLTSLSGSPDTSLSPVGADPRERGVPLFWQMARTRRSSMKPFRVLGFLFLGSVLVV